MSDIEGSRRGANPETATVVYLHSHPAWVAAQRRAHERREAMRRHPSYQSRLGGIAEAEPVVLDELSLRRARKEALTTTWLPAN